MEKLLNLKGITPLTKNQQATVTGGDIIDTIVEWCQAGNTGGSILHPLICPDESN